jgi:hypothetical protein
VQVYGGTTSIMIGSYLWSLVETGRFSTVRSGDTYCSGCAVNVSDVAIINSIAVSNATGKLCPVYRMLQRLCSAHDCVCVLQWLQC